MVAIVKKASALNYIVNVLLLKYTALTHVNVKIVEIHKIMKMKEKKLF